jgi:hypothetical protein
MSVNKTVTLVLQRSTHGTHVYAEAETQSHKQTFPTIYVKKHVFEPGKEPPLLIEVTIKEGGQS